MKNLGRVIGVLLIVAVPAFGLWLLANKSAEPVRPPFVPAPLYRGEPQDGLTFTTRSVVNAVTDVRGFDYLALYVPEGKPPSDFLEPGPFTATFRGRLRIPTRERYEFTVVGTGTFELQIGDTIVVKSDGSKESATGKRIRLKKGEHPLTGRYRSPGQGPSVMRVYWECGEFGREPIPPAALHHERSPSVEQYATLRRGRQLVRNLRCGSCHFEAIGGRSAPALIGVGSRLRAGWMARWIVDPKALRPTATMPKAVHGATGDARDIATYLVTLVTLGTPAAAPAFTATERTDGAEIFADRGCIACHTLPAHKDRATVHDRIPLARVATKWHPAALVEFLGQPARHYPGIMMPDFGFDVAEARAVAAFLLDASLDATTGQPLPNQAEAGDASRGERLVRKHGCAACHGISVPNEMTAPPRAITRDGRVDCKAMDFGFDDGDRAALQSYLGRDMLGHATEAESVERGLVARRCVACHAMRDRPSLYSRVREETTSLVEPDPSAEGVQLPPDLTYAGARLRTEWLVAWLRGEIADRPRPWLHMSMPKFSLAPEFVARGLAFAQGFGPSGASPNLWAGTKVAEATIPGFAQPDASHAELAGFGRRLLRQDGGFGCDQCHAVGGHKAQGVFEAPGVNLAQAARRLRKEYFHRWMWDPTRVDPTTKMTRFVDADGSTGLTDVLAGNGRAQHEAIWRYLSDPRGLPR